MNPQEKIAKLEGLLARVKERSEGQRPNGAAAVAAKPAHSVRPSAAMAEPAMAEAEEELHLPTTPPGADTFAPEPERAAKPLVVSMPPLPETSGWSDPPPPETTIDHPDTTIVSRASVDDSDVDVEVSTEVVEIDIDEPALVHGERGFVPAESGAQPVAEHVAEDPLPEELPEDLIETATSHPPEALDFAPPPPANEVVEPEPSSSPRPIAAEVDAYEAAESAYEEESSPRHTPPPESGKQVAAAPSVRPEPLRKPSLPPEFSGQGAWREPGISIPREPSRVPPAAMVPPSVPPAAATVAPTGPEVTRPALSSDVHVVAIEATAPSFSPATFGELLDATLSL